jgi:hypothetical protein
VFLSGDLLFNFTGKPQKLLPQSRGEKGEKKKLIRASVAINFSHRCKEIKRIISV